MADLRTLATLMALCVACPLAGARGSPPPPPVPPMAASLDTTDWIFVKNIHSFQRGKITFCVKSSIMSGCEDMRSMTPQEALLQVGPKGAELTGFSPYIDTGGNMNGMVLYYKSAP